MLLRPFVWKRREKEQNSEPGVGKSAYPGPSLGRGSPASTQESGVRARAEPGLPLPRRCEEQVPRPSLLSAGS